MTLLSKYEQGIPFDGDYAKALKKLQKRLAKLQALHIVHDCKSMIIFQGWDAAGKGGAIKRMCAFWDPRYYEVYPISAPTQEEKEKHFLWRFWTKLPRAKEITVLDRSYYGRVLVERVEGFASESEWRRGYDEINEFEAQQIDIGTKIIKIFIHVTPKAQDERLKERLENPSKRWKITKDDFRNREKREAYAQAMEEMFVNNDTRWAPWKIIDGNDKKAARLAILDYVADQLAAHVPADFPEAEDELSKMAAEAFEQ